jgi:hypothetical protein
MYVKNNIEVHSCNHFCSRKAKSITYVKCVSVALAIQLAMRLRYIAICGLAGCTTFFHIISYAALLSKKVMGYKTFVLILSTSLVLIIFHSKNWVRYNQNSTLAVMQSICYSCQILVKLSTYFRKIFKYWILRKSFRWEPRYSMRKEEQTDIYIYRHDKPHSRFSQFWERA